MKPQIINIINFVRGTEPRNPNLDLAEPVRKQIEILKFHNLAATFLLQYDAMLRDDITCLFHNTSFDIGVWFEIVQPLAEKAGVRWKGRPGFSWDWHANSGFTIGYSPEEREKMIDVFMSDFRSMFGHYPKSAGCWLIDAHSLEYLSQKYGIEAFCNCRDQWGTDGYTLWGGYYGQGYYPSRFNSFIPAQSKKNQIDVPVFRMLGSDPIYQYGAGFDEHFNPSDWQHVKTLEPANESAGGSPEWVRWYFKENFNGICLSFGYAQAGQENSFGWEPMRKGIEDQFGLIAEYSSAGKLQVLTLQETGKWYKSRYGLTPASSIAALSDWSDMGNRAVWYCSRYYRASIFWGKCGLNIRDIHIFDEDYREMFLESICESETCIYDSLPLMDGNRWSGNDIRAGIYLAYRDESGNFTFPEGGEAKVSQLGDDRLNIAWPLKTGEVLQIGCCPETLEAELENAKQGLEWALVFRAGVTQDLPQSVAGSASVDLIHNGFRYHAAAETGAFYRGEGANFLYIKPKGGRIILNFEQ